jgi:hypothetical protein
MEPHPNSALRLTDHAFPGIEAKRLRNKQRRSINKWNIASRAPEIVRDAHRQSAQVGSFTRTAGILNVTQSAASGGSARLQAYL